MNRGEVKGRKSGLGTDHDTYGPWQLYRFRIFIEFIANDFSLLSIIPYIARELGVKIIYKGSKSYRIVFDSTYTEEGRISLIIVTIESRSGKIIKLYYEIREKYSNITNYRLIIP